MRAFGPARTPGPGTANRRRFSLVVWAFWLVPCFSPMFFALATR